MPFIVLFCHVIETSDLDDLRRLAEFTDGLQPALTVSQAIERFYCLCKLLHQMASLYVETIARGQQNHDTSMSSSNFDTYLSRLGLIPSQSPDSGSGVDSAG